MKFTIGYELERTALKQILKNDVEIMKALVSVMYRQQPGGGEMSFESTQEYLVKAIARSNDVIQKL